MSPTTLIPRRPQGLQGRHVLVAIIAFFGTVFLVNGALIYEAVSTHTGLVANEPYRKGLAYNERIGADERQARLGWTETLQVGRDSHVMLALAERDGRPVRGLKVEAVLGRPADQPLRRRARARRDGAGPVRNAGGGDRRRQLVDCPRGALADGCRADLSLAEAPVAGAMTPAAFAARSLPHVGAASEDASRPVTTMLAVENMHCGGCMRKVEARAWRRCRASPPPAPTSPPGASLPYMAPRAWHQRPRRRPGTRRLQGRRAGRAAGRPAKQADRDLLRRLGVAGFAAANVMLLSVSVWSGAAGDMTPSVQALFHWLSALIALAGDGLCRPAVLPLRCAGPARAAPEHGRADLARRDAGDGHEPLPDHRAAASRSISTLPSRCCSSCCRPLPRPAHARARGGAAANLFGAARSHGHRRRSDGTTERLGARLLEPGMRILTAAGERFAVDGRVAGRSRRDR